ncbi:probable carboxypeptidase S-like 2 [Gordionus sp. m RMFG-2023]|uniref:probable carboxypeptidase S-like 2 n=1 Tax=Gordionus sp. m RMFG-2023 TaxID=3053472 RepID=UPI0031FBCCF3
MQNLLLIIASFLLCSISKVQNDSGIEDKEISEKQSDIDLDAAIKRFSKAITFETVSIKPGEANVPELLKFRKYLESAYPLMHSTPWIERQIVGNLSLVYTIMPLIEDDDKFTNKPWILQAHLDVVLPTDPHKWDANPFGGQIIYKPKNLHKILYDPKTNKSSKKFSVDDIDNKDYYLYGRGTIDSKHIIMSIMEAIEHMIRQGLRPNTKKLILSFGHDEEVGGMNGARKIVSLLGNTYSFPPKGGKPIDFLLDEGLTVVKDVLPRNTKLAPVCVSEKYVMNVNISVESIGGHSSLSGKENAISILSGAVTKIQTKEFPSFLDA